MSQVDDDPTTASGSSGCRTHKGGTIPILDMGMATGQRAIPENEVEQCFVIITEYNRKTQGFFSQEG